MSEQLTRHGRYPLADNPPKGGNKRDYRAVWTGEFRPPRRGEWYLSGAIIEAYRAHSDLSMPFHIAKLLKGETVTVWRDAA